MRDDKSTNNDRPLRASALLGGHGDAPTTVPETRDDTLRDSVYGASDTGQQRDHNEDAYLVGRSWRYFAVADGMGGHQAGEVASAAAMNLIEKRLSADVRLASNDADSAQRYMTGLCLDTHANLQRLAETRPEWSGMGTTLILACVIDGVLYTVHVGDARCYLLSDSHLTRVTFDHSVVALMVRDGLLTDAEARHHPRKNEVLQALGTPDGITPEFHATKLNPGDRVLLCSDGLWEALTDDEISTVLQSDGSMRQLSQALIGRANHSGGEDNITVVLYEHMPAQRGPCSQ